MAWITLDYWSARLVMDVNERVVWVDVVQYHQCNDTRNDLELSFIAHTTNKFEFPAVRKFRKFP